MSLICARRQNAFFAARYQVRYCAECRAAAQARHGRLQRPSPALAAILLDFGLSRPASGAAAGPRYNHQYVGVPAALYLVT